MSQLSELCASQGVTIRAVYTGPVDLDTEFPRLTWDVRVRFNDRSVTSQYSAGIGHAHKPPNSHPYSAPQNPRYDWTTDRSIYGRDLRNRWLRDPRCAPIPDVADVLYCLCSDACCGESSFDDFCSELGYDNDSRKAEKVWNTCRDMCIKMRVLLGAEFDDFANAEH